MLAVTNFPRPQVANFISEVLVLGVVLNDGEVVLIQPDRDVAMGNGILEQVMIFLDKKYCNYSEIY